MAEQHETRVSRLGYESGPDHISVAVDENIYPLEAVYGACYLFLDRCFIYLSRSPAGTIDVRLTVRDGASAAMRTPSS